MSRRRARDEFDSSRSRTGRNDSASQPVPSTSRRRETTFASQATGSRKSKNDVDSAELESMIEEDSYTAAMNALCLSSSGKPFKKADLLQGCIASQRRADADSIIQLAGKHLRTTYGFRLVAAGPKFFVSAEKSIRFPETLAQRSSQPQEFTTFLGVVLTLIFLQKGEVEDDFLKNTMLLKLFPDIKTNPHPFFGNVDKLFTEMEQQLYITKETQVRNNEIKTFYKWGPRSNVEFDKRTLMTPLLTAMFGHNIPDSVWSEADALPENSVVVE